jgi:hypothetical protein
MAAMLAAAPGFPWANAAKRGVVDDGTPRVTRWVVAVELTMELSAHTQEEAEQRARQALRSRCDSGARITRQQVRWVLADSEGADGSPRSRTDRF